MRDAPMEEHVTLQAGSTVLGFLALAGTDEVPTEDLSEVLDDSGATLGGAHEGDRGGFKQDEFGFPMDDRLRYESGGIDGDWSIRRGDGIGELYGRYGS